MNQFSQAFCYINEVFYKPNHLTIQVVQEETQNFEYGAGVFQLNCRSVRFKVAKITPTKIGQFVAFWDKPTSKQAITTQKWQLPYFVEVDPRNNFNIQYLVKLYTV